MIDPATREAIGRTALSVSRLGFGSAPLGGLFQSTSQGDAAQSIAAAWTRGLRYFDTAPKYGSGLAERRGNGGRSLINKLRCTPLTLSAILSPAVPPIPRHVTPPSFLG